MVFLKERLETKFFKRYKLPYSFFIYIIELKSNFLLFYEVVFFCLFFLLFSKKSFRETNNYYHSCKFFLFDQKV